MAERRHRRRSLLCGRARPSSLNANDCAVSAVSGRLRHLNASRRPFFTALTSWLTLEIVVPNIVIFEVPVLLYVAKPSNVNVP